MGITTNLSRRLRQHNGAVVGGAKATRIGRPWKIGLTVEGFGRPTTTTSSSSNRRKRSDRSTETATGAAAATTGKRSCLQFEYMWKHMAPKQSHGKQARLIKLHHLLCKERWTTKSVEARTIPLTVTIYDRNSSGDDNDDDDEDSSNYDDDAIYQLVTTGSSRQIGCNTLKGKSRAKDTIRSKGETRTRTRATTTALLPEYVQVQVVQDDFADV